MRLPKHHPSEATLLSYSAGALDPASTAVIERHALVCPPCVQTLELGDKIGAVVVSTVDPTPLPELSLEDALGRLNQPSSLAGVWHDKMDLQPVGLRWAALSPAVKSRLLWREDDNSLHLVQLAPGGAIPMHKHAGLELMLVLDGAFTDGQATYEVGDVCEADQDVMHEPRTVGDKACLCLVSFEGTLEYCNLRHRIRQKIFGL